MEFSSTTTKWVNSLDYSFYKNFIMTKQERKEKIQELTSIILDLKMAGGKSIKTKNTIQKLQQELDKLVHGIS